ncbi:MAG TPA: hypothetical protein VM450_06350 [Thermomicrobiales bacterium]|nr:hypothetical protein [Thermomicrobiales bacterium]
MSDRDVQREIEANERRARDEEDVGVDEDVLREDDNSDRGIFTRLLDVDADDPNQEAEFDDNTKTTDTGA